MVPLSCGRSILAGCVPRVVTHPSHCARSSFDHLHHWEPTDEEDLLPALLGTFLRNDGFWLVFSVCAACSLLTFQSAAVSESSKYFHYYKDKMFV